MRILKRKQKMGFTLTELMAVVVIIGIIAGLALGSYRSITEKAVFNEGLGIAHAVAAAADEFYYEYHKKPENLEDLVIDVKDITFEGNDISATRFTGQFTPDSSVVVSSRDYPYSITVFMQYHSQQSDVCTGRDAKGDGEKFCQSLGYTDCTDQGCSKE
ncbi:MAG: type II secretion system protein [Elusimicrobiaceae bacterium]|nr:type II secretion system protein [Elusimicrobiaceae bacterium]